MGRLGEWLSKNLPKTPEQEQRLKDAKAQLKRTEEVSDRVDRILEEQIKIVRRES